MRSCVMRRFRSDVCVLATKWFAKWILDNINMIADRKKNRRCDANIAVHACILYEMVSECDRRRFIALTLARVCVCVCVHAPRERAAHPIDRHATQLPLHGAMCAPWARRRTRALLNLWWRWNHFGCIGHLVYIMHVSVFPQRVIFARVYMDLNTSETGSAKDNLILTWIMYYFPGCTFLYIKGN